MPPDTETLAQIAETTGATAFEAPTADDLARRLRQPPVAHRLRRRSTQEVTVAFVGARPSLRRRRRRPGSALVRPLPLIDRSLRERDIRRTAGRDGAPFRVPGGSPYGATDNFDDTRVEDPPVTVKPGALLLLILATVAACGGSAAPATSGAPPAGATSAPARATTAPAPPAGGATSGEALCKLITEADVAAAMSQPVKRTSAQASACRLGPRGHQQHPVPA